MRASGTTVIAPNNAPGLAEISCQGK